MIKIKNVTLFLLFICCTWYSGQLFAQQNFPINGSKNSKAEIYAFKNANIINAENSILNTTVLVEKNRIKAIGNEVSIPAGAVVYDLEGKFIYPSFIELFGSYGLQKVTKNKVASKPQYNRLKNNSGGWNDAFHPQQNAVDNFVISTKESKVLRKLGFGVVLSHIQDGIARGTGVLVNLNDESSNKAIIKKSAASFYSFDKGTSNQKYPSSLMGAIALIRQNEYDLQWYSSLGEEKVFDASFEAMMKHKDLSRIFSVKDYQSGLRADRVGDEFGYQYLIKGSGDEYKRINEIKRTNASYILPLKFPKAYDVEDPFDALNISLAKMKHWELAPSNPSILDAAGINIAFTKSGLDKKDDFLKQVRKAIIYGLPEKRALAALTINPARMIGIGNELGSVEVGKRANFLITSGAIFEKETVVYENWVDGIRYMVSSSSASDIEGRYNVNIDGNLFQLDVNKHLKEGSYEGMISRNGKKEKVKITVEAGLVSFTAKDNLSPFKTPFSFSGKINFKGKIWDGKARDIDEKWFDWSAVRQKKSSKSKTAIASNIEQGEVFYPLNGYGYKEFPRVENMFIENITIWSCDSNGVFLGDVIIKDGKIIAVGPSLEMEDGLVKVNGAGKHLTPGIIDEHSHIGISRGVNEGTHASSAEVRIGDVVNPDDINIYRQLAGGVTTSQLLHGSANPIGGQSALIKLKWGQSAEEMKIENAPGFIKFALGENVKQSNWGDSETVRFPQSRMGVEQVYYEAFIRAKEYQKKWSVYQEDESKFKLPFFGKDAEVKPRRNLQLEAIVEILDSTRFITCHSYVQSEINMLMHVGDSMGFTVNTFTHILEGYKLADKMRKHGAAGSTFADWWAYKFEVNDAIPYNAAILNEQGVLTGINSDDAEMGRRLNQEAAKTIKYGNVKNIEALKMVTINPAKMLHLDQRIGSITVGKDADLVIWNGNPLSVYSKPETTMIEGVIYYSLEKNKALLERTKKERARLIKKMLEAKNKGEKTQKVVLEKKHLYHCDTMEEEY